MKILPPISRICEVIDGTSPVQLALALGLDTSRMTGRSLQSGYLDRDDDVAFRPRSSLPDEERFAGCQPLLVRCLRCGTDGTFLGAMVAAPGQRDAQYGLHCARAGCSGFWGSKDAPQPRKVLPNELDVCLSRLSNAAAIMVRRMTAQYQAGWMTCEDNSCAARTRALTGRESGTACPRANCSSHLKPECDASQVHQQLEYLANLFNLKRARERLAAAHKADPLHAPEPLKALCVKETGRTCGCCDEESYHIESVFRSLSEQMEAYLKACEYHFVSLPPLFAYVGRLNKKCDLPKLEPPLFKADKSAATLSPSPAFITPAKTRAAGSSLSAMGAAYSIDGNAAEKVDHKAADKMRRLNPGFTTQKIAHGGGFMALREDAA
jgi:hypothetical protein